ncbi:hypothetical protein FSARC_14962 [Fusarium sarcochroum]|uniref:Uncharacterized protein n=1 Tax=Fusarium sarcochroum TaxID=1208366 RepID=A0A8H4SPP2_9HYPO|nr:hypothetical protein FSARC_14962 [Fusarium sarcochroum]
MPVPEVNDVLRFEGYQGQESDSASIEVNWSQSLRSKSATYYIVNAKNTAKGNADTILFIQKPMYTDESIPDHISKIPGAQKKDDGWEVPISDRFQYGQKNSQGEQRFLVLHDKANKIYQHRFLTTTIQGNAAEWAQKLAKSFGAGDLSDQVSKLGKNFVGDYLKTF